MLDLLAWPLDSEDRPCKVIVESHIDATRSLAWTVQKFPRVIPLSLNCGNLAVYVFGFYSNIEGVSVVRLLQRSALGPEAERLAETLDLPNRVVCK